MRLPHLDVPNCPEASFPSPPLGERGHRSLARRVPFEDASVQKMEGTPVTAVTPAEIAGRTNLPHETGRTGGLQATGQTMRGDCQRVFRAYCGRST
jgi:hypothetical protein